MAQLALWLVPLRLCSAAFCSFPAAHFLLLLFGKQSDIRTEIAMTKCFHVSVCNFGGIPREIILQRADSWSCSLYSVMCERKWVVHNLISYQLLISFSAIQHTMHFFRSTSLLLKQLLCICLIYLFLCCVLLWKALWAAFNVFLCLFIGFLKSILWTYFYVFSLHFVYYLKHHTVKHFELHFMHERCYTNEVIVMITNEIAQL